MIDAVLADPWGYMRLLCVVVPVVCVYVYMIFQMRVLTNDGNE